MKIHNWHLIVGSKAHMKYSQGDAQLSRKLDGSEPRSENTQYMMVPQDLIVFFSAWKKR
jgi:hypothetical protein